MLAFDIVLNIVRKIVWNMTLFGTFGTFRTFGTFGPFGTMFGSNIA